MSLRSLQSRLATPPDPAGTLPRRSSRTWSEKWERSSLPTGAQIVYRVGRSILRRDRDDLEDTLLQFHASPVIQAECRLVIGNANRYLQARHQPCLGRHYVAACDIPAGVRLAFYSGLVVRGMQECG
jgi:hypothetical protein